MRKMTYVWMGGIGRKDAENDFFQQVEFRVQVDALKDDDSDDASQRICRRGVSRWMVRKEVCSAMIYLVKDESFVFIYSEEKKCLYV